MPPSRRTDVQRSPFPERLLTQKSRVDDGTVENTVSMRTVSVENVSRLFGDVVKSSISSHALKPNTPSTHIIIYI